MHRTLGDGLIAGARIGLLALVAFSAAAYGLTRDWTIEWFNIGGGGVFALWLLGHLIALRRPSTGFLPWLLVFLILAFGWLSTVAGYFDDYLMDSSEEYPDIYSQITSYGSYSFESSMAAMFRTSALLGLFLVSIDTLSSRRWGRALLAVLAATALGIAALFYLQQPAGSPFRIRDIFDRTYLHFATYRYWGNGASFLGLLWPLFAAIAIHAARRKAPGWSLWMAGAILVFAAIYLNLSKAGHILGAAGLLLFLVLAAIHLARSGFFQRLQIRPAVVAIILVPLLVVATSLYFAIPKKRWERLADNGVEKNPRMIAYEYFIQMVPEAGWTGFGPGTFAEAHRPLVENDPRIRKVPFWVAHQDYLQTIIEWGYAGTTLWALLFVPSGIRLLGRAVRGTTKRSEAGGRIGYYDWRDRLQAAAEAVPAPANALVQCAAVTAISVTALHSMVDFPMQIESLQFYFLIWIALGWVPKKALPGQEA